MKGAHLFTILARFGANMHVQAPTVSPGTIRQGHVLHLFIPFSFFSASLFNPQISKQKRLWARDLAHGFVVFIYFFFYVVEQYSYHCESCSSVRSFMLYLWVFSNGNAAQFEHDKQLPPNFFLFL